jgi:hypothetical protein
MPDRLKKRPWKQYEGYDLNMARLTKKCKYAKMEIESSRQKRIDSKSRGAKAKL